MEAAGSAPAVALSPDAPAYLLSTSGSTGEPKGVLITHRNVTAFAAWAVDHFGVRAGDRLSAIRRSTSTSRRSTSGRPSRPAPSW